MGSNWPSGRRKGWSFGLENAAPYPETKALIRREKKIETVTAVHVGGSLSDAERGALLSPSIAISGEGTSVTIGSGGEFDPDLVRSTLLLFDKIDYPRNQMVQLGPEAPPGLESWRGLQRSVVEMSGYMTPTIFQTAFLAAFEALNEQNDGRWSIARAASTLALPASAFGERNAFLIRLENALPIPDRSVSYDEVLNYRRRRNDEILALRHHIEDIAIAVGNSGFGGLEEQVAYEKFVQSIENYARVAKEENFLKRLTSLEIKFNWDKLVQNIPTSAALSAVFGKLAVLHAIGASISIESTLGMRKTSATPRPFDYLFIAKSEM